MAFIIPIIGGLIMYLVIHALVRSPGKVLNAKFVKLGTLKGKTFQEITAACGQPNSVSATAEGVKVCQWMATGYHIALLFDENDVCLGVSHEAKV
ncbi:MAG: hypothetical protein IJT91_08230 [Clostridia bacterium]|nr:hypothetical protein [Clostridia bacterium]